MWYSEELVFRGSSWLHLNGHHYSPRDEKLVSQSLTCSQGVSQLNAPGGPFAFMKLCIVIILVNTHWNTILPYGLSLAAAATYAQP